jgi:U32 family peptidase
MKLVVPLTDPKYYEAISDAGADEFYCGFVPYEWIEKYVSTITINRREWFLGAHNITNMESMIALKRNEEKVGKPIKITINGKYYIPEQYPEILEIMNRLLGIGFESYIISDFGLLLYLQEHGFDGKLHVSGLAGIRNVHALKFFSQFNIERIVFPRKISPENMNTIISAFPNYEYEAFFLNERCLFSEEFCNCLLCERVTSVCTINYKAAWVDDGKFTNSKRLLSLQNRMRAKDDMTVENILKTDNRLGIRGCGLCMYRDLESAGVTHLKIVGRMMDHTKIIEDIRVAKEVSQMAAKDNTEFKTQVKQTYFNGKCPVSCYYLQ